MSIPLETVLAAKKKLRAQIGLPDWLRGIGVGVGIGGAQCVKVNVHSITPEVIHAIPTEIDGVPIDIYSVGDIVAADSEEL